MSSTATLPELQHPDFAGLAYRLLASAQPPRRLLVLLHGVGGNEANLAGVAEHVPADTLTVLPRGPLAMGPQQFGWFQVQFTAQGPQINPAQADASRRLLIGLLAKLQNDHGIDAAHTVIAGFSQGGIMSAAVALTAPERVTGFGVLAGRILPDLEPLLAPREQLARLRAFIGHGRADDKLPVSWAERADRWLTELGIPHELLLDDAGHGLSMPMLLAFQAWLQRTDQPWNG